MSDPEQQAEPQAATETTESTASLLDQAIGATKQTEPDRAKELIESLTREALSGTVTWSKNLTITFREAIGKIDAAVSKQLAAVMHASEFSKLEGSWRGLHKLVMDSETGEALKIRMMDLDKKTLFKDLSRAVEFDQSQTWKKLYEAEFGQAGGAPYGALIGDYAITNHPDDIELLQQMSGVAAGSFCPFITSPDSSFMGFDSWEELNQPRDLAKIFESQEYTKWRAFRDSDESRFVTMAMPRTMARLPYGAATNPVEEFAYEEVPIDDDGTSEGLPSDHYCWSSAAYALGGVLTRAHAETGWCTAIRGAEGGGKVEGMPMHVYTSKKGDTVTKCPTEVQIPERRDRELSLSGFMPLNHYKDTNYAVFFGGQTAQRPKKYDDPDAQANAEISARLPYIMATSRFAHYLKVMARDKLGSFMEASDCENWLNNWIQGYVNGNAGSGQEMKAKYPLAEARVDVQEIPGAPGSYNAVAYLRPWLQMEELTASMRLVAKIPAKQG